MAKQTLYEILGIADDAPGEEVERAYDERRRLLLRRPDGEDRRNQLSFLQHARDVIADPRRRAAYDGQDRAAGPASGPPVAESRTGRGVVVALAVLAVAGLLGRQLLPARERAPAPPQAVVAANPAPRPAPADLPAVEDVVAALPPDSEAPDPGAASQPAAPATKAPPPRIALTIAGNPLMNRILQSTYAIVGSQGLGTGVAVEADRLLTNCHVIAPNVLKGKIYAISPVTGASVEITDAAFLVREDACVVHVPGLAAQPIALGDTSRLQRGARLHNIGFGDGRLTLAEGLYIGSLLRFGQYYMVSTNRCTAGVSGGPLVDDDGRLIGLTSGGARDSRGNALCASLTVETARLVLSERMMQIDAFPTNYVTNWTGRK